MRIGLIAVVAVLCVAATACAGGGGKPSAAKAPTASRIPSRPILAAASPRPSPSPSQVASGPLVYAAIGASDTVGVGAADPAREGWVPRLAGMLGPKVQLHNLGVSGTVL